MSRVRQNYWANLVAALASFAVAAGWYSFFMQSWLSGINRTMAGLRATGWPEWVPYVVALAMAYVMATGISCITQLAGPQTGARGIRTGFLLWLGFIFTSFAIEYTYEVRPVLFAINAGYWLLSMTLMGLIVGGWSRKQSSAATARPERRAAAVK